MIRVWGRISQNYSTYKRLTYQIMRRISSKLFSSLWVIASGCIRKVSPKIINIWWDNVSEMKKVALKQPCTKWVIRIRSEDSRGQVATLNVENQNSGPQHPELQLSQCFQVHQILQIPDNHQSLILPHWHIVLGLGLGGGGGCIPQNTVVCDY